MKLPRKRPQCAHINSNTNKADYTWNRSLASVRVPSSLKVGNDCARSVSMECNTITQQREQNHMNSLIHYLNVDILLFTLWGNAGNPFPEVSLLQSISPELLPIEYHFGGSEGSRCPEYKYCQCVVVLDRFKWFGPTRGFFPLSEILGLRVNDVSWLSKAFVRQCTSGWENDETRHIYTWFGTFQRAECHQMKAKSFNSREEKYIHTDFCGVPKKILMHICTAPWVEFLYTSFFSLGIRETITKVYPPHDDDFVCLQHPSRNSCNLPSHTLWVKTYWWINPPVGYLE